MKPILFNTEMVRALLDGRKTTTRRTVKESAVDKFVLSTDGRILGSYSDDHPECGVYPTVDDAPYLPGDILYVRETWRVVDWLEAVSLKFEYAADGRISDFIDFTSERLKKFQKYVNRKKWCPNIFMPREAARIFLRVTDVRVERLNDITVEGALCEGISDVEPPPICKKEPSYPESFPKGFDKWSAEKREDWIQSAARARYIGWCEYADKLLEKFGAIWNNTIKKADLPISSWEANPWVWVIEFEEISKEEAVSHDD